MNTCISRQALACALFATTAITSPAIAQEASVLPFPVRQYQDENGVDLLSGVFTTLSPSVRIGSPEMGLSYTRHVRRETFRDNLVSNIWIDGSTYIVGVGSSSQEFTLANGVFTPKEQNGSTLILSAGVYTYTTRDGTVGKFSNAGTYDAGNAQGITIDSITYPSGRTLNYYYKETTWTDARGSTRAGRRIQSTTTNAGYHIKFTYATETASGNGSEWARITNVKGLNSATDVCGVQDATCPQTGRPELTIATVIGAREYIDSEGRKTTYTLSAGAVTAVRLPGSTSDDISVTYTSGRVTSITRFGVTTGYAYADANGVRTVTVTRPGGSTRVATFDIAKNLMLSDRDELNRTTSYQYDTNNRPTRVTRPEGNYIQVAYDARGNVTEQRAVAKSGSGLADIVTTAGYSSTCANAKTCNQPTWTKDPKGNQTDYTYDGSHGGLLTATAPAPSTGAVRPETRVTYSRLGSNGAVSTTGIFVPTGTSTCQTAASCAGTADEVKTSIAYGYGLLPSSTSSGAGNGSLTATNAMTYDAVGNLLTVDGPLPGTDDTTRYRYNLNREQVGVIGPDPDGAGALKNRAQRVTIDSRGLVTTTENGTTAGQTDAAWSAFTPTDAVDVDYDSHRRVTSRKLRSGTTTYAVTETSYDSRGRGDCVTQRMNPAAFSALPPSACTLGSAGSHGPDRVTQTIYNAASEVTQVQVGVGTADAANERTMTYTSNGQVATLKDAENNLTTYEYDGFDRLAKTRYPLPTKGSNASSTTDYEQPTYDANSNVTAFRNRADETIAFMYDDLNRVTLKNLPGTEPDVSYGYDLLSRLTSAAQTGNSLAFTWDALSRNLTQVGPQGTVSSAWDLAGRRTQLTYPGTGLYVNYDYLVTGEMTKVRENGATSGAGVLATYAYDDLGRRTNVTFGNGAVQAYTFDPVSRLASLTNNLSGTTNDLSATFAYSPASQITSNVRAGDTYAWTGHFNENKAGTANGLNQLTQYGAKALSHDARGNVTWFGTKGFGYSSENLLKAGPNSTSLGYDPAMRLYHVVSGATTTRFAYDGLDRIAEHDGANALQRRYVHGPGVDDPIVWYEGSGTVDRRFLSADERGSIVSVTDSAGSLLRINRYDEYGQPQSTNLGKWGYTGQAWLPEIGAYYYKARVYEPELGRFVQPDPIGYGDGMNLYAYVGNDPVNGVDSTGLVQCTGSRIEQSSCSDMPMLSCAGECKSFAPLLAPRQSGTSLTSGGSFRWVPGGPSTGGRHSQEPIVVTYGRWVWEPGSAGTLFVNWATVAPPPGLTRRRTARDRSPPAYDPNKNWCGGEGGAGLPNRVGNASINDLCYGHDVCYGGTGVPRGQCDWTFGLGVGMRVAIGNSQQVFPFSVFIPTFAGISAFAIVRFEGDKYYVPR